MSMVEYAVVPLADQVLEIRVAGEAVALFEPNVAGPVDDPDLVTPDPVEFLAGCVEAGFFPCHEPALGPAALHIRDRRYDPASLSQTWQVELVNLDLAVPRVLLSLLEARRLDHISLRSRGDGPLTPATQPPARFPAVREPLEFALDHDEPEFPDRGRALAVTLGREPTDDELEDLYRMFDTWVTLLLLGAYPPHGVSAADSGVIPDLAALTEPARVEQSFDEAFICHEDAFNPVIEGLRRCHRTRLPIVAVSIT